MPLRNRASILAALAVPAVGLFFLAGCNAQKALTAKRIKSVEKGLMRAVYLQGLKPEKMTLSERMRFYKVPGVGIAVLDRNVIEWVRAYGEKDPQTGQPLTTGTLFQGGAFSQMMTAAAAVRLAEQGKLNLDADISDLLRTWKFPLASFGFLGKITPRDLLTHSAGLASQVFSGYAQDEPIPTLRQILDGEKPATNGPVWIPAKKSSASRIHYSDAGYAILEQVLIDLAGLPFPAFMKQTVLDPLGLQSSTFESPLPDDLRMRAAVGYNRGGQVVNGLWSIYPAAAADGLWTTPSDFAGFLSEVLLEATGAGTAKLLSPETARSMLSPQVEGTGFGFVVEGKGDDINFNLRGKTHGYACFMTLFPARSQGAVIMTNSDNGMFLIQEILAALSEAYSWPFYRPEEKPVLRLDPATYQAYAGRYEVNPDYVLDVSAQDYYLVIQPTGQAPTKFYAESQTLFYSTDPNIRIQFTKTKDGAVNGLILWQQDFELEAKKTK